MTTLCGEESCCTTLEVPGDITREVTRVGPLKGYFHCAEKKGYSGVGIYSRHEPSKIVEGVGIPEIDREGRYNIPNECLDGELAARELGYRAERSLRQGLEAYGRALGLARVE